MSKKSIVLIVVAFLVGIALAGVITFLVMEKKSADLSLNYLKQIDSIKSAVRSDSLGIDVTEEIDSVYEDSVYEDCKDGGEEYVYEDSKQEFFYKPVYKIEHYDDSIAYELEGSSIIICDEQGKDILYDDEKTYIYNDAIEEIVWACELCNQLYNQTYRLYGFDIDERSKKYIIKNLTAIVRNLPLDENYPSYVREAVNRIYYNERNWVDKIKLHEQKYGIIYYSSYVNNHRQGIAILRKEGKTMARKNYK